MKFLAQTPYALVLLLTAALLVISVSGQMAEDRGLADRIDQLRAEIAHHDDLYFRQGTPEITDYEYDLLKLELTRLEAESGEIPTRDSIGDDRLAQLDQIAHGRPMLSLGKAYSDEQVTEFFDEAAQLAMDGVVRFSLEPKFDGVAVSVVMDHGKFVSAATRGNGMSGENITDQVRVVRNLDYEWEIDLTRPRIERIELRGEVYLSHAAFDALNADRLTAAEEPFRHPRSVAAGSVKLDDLATVAKRGLSLVIHGWGEVYPAAAEPESMMDFQRWLEICGLPSVSQARILTTASASELNQTVAALHASLADYPTDGIVIKVDLIALQQKMGVGATAPRWALARKFAPPRAETILRDIVWQVGRTGVLTPVAEFDPVVLGGATIRRASLSNAREIERRDLRLGDLIWVEKAGEIIPQVAGVLVGRRSANVVPYTLPGDCPSCGQALASDEQSHQLICDNYECEDQIVERLLHFVSKDAMHIRGLGPATARRLVSSELVCHPSDLYLLTAEQLEGLPGVGSKTAQRLLNELQGSREASLEKWIIALGLPGVGKSSAKQLAEEIDALSDLLDDSRRKAALSVLGPATTQQVEEHLSRPQVRETIATLVEHTETP